MKKYQHISKQEKRFIRRSLIQDVIRMRRVTSLSEVKETVREFEMRKFYHALNLYVSKHGLRKG